MTINPLLWLHSRITGSSRTNIIVTAIYAGLVLSFSVISFYVAATNTRPNDRPQTFAQLNAVWLIIMTIAQGIFLLLLAPSAVRRAVQRDCDSGMMESLRLTPMSNRRIVLGYLIGCPIQPLMLYAVSLVFGSYFAAAYGGSPGLGGALGAWSTLSGWYFAQGCLLVIAAMITAGVLLSALATRGKSNVAGALMLISLLGGWFAIMFIPGLTLVLGVLSGGVLFKLMTSAKLGGDPLTIVQAGFFQIAFCLVFFAAACHKLRGPDKPLFSLALGLILAGTWAAALIAGFRASSSAQWLFENIDQYRMAQWICSTVAFMAVCYFALWAAARGLLARRSKSSERQPRGGSRALRYSLIPALLAIATVLCMFAMYKMLPSQALPAADRHALASYSQPFWIAVGAAMLLSFWTDFNLIQALIAGMKKSIYALLGALVLLKGMPLLIDQIFMFAIEGVGDSRWTGRGYCSAVSPIGTLIYAATGGWAIWTGLGVQGVIAVVATVLGARARNRIQS